MKVLGVKYVLALVAIAGLAFAGGSQAAGHRPVRCAPGDVRRSIRMPERRHGRTVRRHGKIVYTRVQRCVKAKAKPIPPTPTPAPLPGPLPTPTATVTVTTPTPPTATSTTTTPSTTAATTTPTTTTITEPAPPPPPAYSGTCSTPVIGASQTVGGNRYALEGMDTFTKDAAIGSFASSPLAPNNVVYTGDHGMGWTEYPDGWPATYTSGKIGYQPSTVQSVHDGVLDFYLHYDTNGDPVGASPSPLPGGNRYQIYGAWSFCEKIAPDQSYDTPGLADYYQAPLLWPDDSSGANSLWTFAESDYPEGELTNTPHDTWAGYAHYGGQGQQDQYLITQDPNQWHVYTQVWGPGYRSYYADGYLLGTSTNQVWDQPERWQLQIEPGPHPANQGAGHVYVKWVWIGTLA
jgi:hypothetical protein